MQVGTVLDLHSNGLGKKTNKKALTPVAFKLQGRELVPAVPPCLTP
jgi:hypothetical protein